MEKQSQNYYYLPVANNYFSRKFCHVGKLLFFFIFILYSVIDWTLIQ